MSIILDQQLHRFLGNHWLELFGKADVAKDILTIVNLCDSRLWCIRMKIDDFSSDCVVNDLIALVDKDEE